MLGRPVLYTVAAAAIGILSAGEASAGCFSCGCGAPVVYRYVSPCAATYALPPMYVVNQGPAYTLPVWPLAAEPTPAYPYVGLGSYRYRYAAPVAYGEEVDEGAAVYPRAYRPYGYGFNYRFRYRHYGRPYMGMHRYGYRRFAYRPHMRALHRMPMRSPMRHGPMPGFVHPQGKP